MLRTTFLLLCLFLGSVEWSGRVAAGPQTVARMWNERSLAAIRVDTPHPPAQARNYFSFSVCMYDAWAAYDPVAVGYVYRAKHHPPAGMDVATARREAISYAAYQMQKERHAFSRAAATTLAADDTLMVSLGYDINNRSRDPATPAGVGNRIYDAVSAWFLNDGSNQTGGIPYPAKDPPVAYPDFAAAQGGYSYINPPLATLLPGISDGSGHTVVDVNHWQRLQIVNAVDQNGFPQGPVQLFLGAQWLGVRPFSLSRSDPAKLWIDPGPPPYFGGATHAQFVKEAVANITADGQLTPDDGEMIDISPGGWGNNSLDFAGEYGDGSFKIYDGHGYAINPVTGQPYAPNVVKRGDFARVLAEFWADGPSSETPPGHWNVIANYLADNLPEKRIGGIGPVIDDLEWDVKTYFALNAALHDAACACWGAKRFYDGWRPITAVRYLGGLGQSSDPSLPSYHPNGLPLIPNLIELVTAQTAAPGGRHAGLKPGKIAVLAWPGPPANAAQQHNGVRWIHCESWSTYQRTNFVTPAFPGYFSGHSTFSRAAAEILTAITGSSFFPGGLGTYTNYVLTFENGPSVPMTLQWATYYDAADQAGISRIWGGIHPPIDNLSGRRAGAQVGKGVWELAKKYWDGSVTNPTLSLTMRNLGSARCELRFDTLRGFYYKLQSTVDLKQPFNDEPGEATLAFDTPLVRTNTMTGEQRYFRAMISPAQ